MQTVSPMFQNVAAVRPEADAAVSGATGAFLSCFDAAVGSEADAMQPDPPHTADIARVEDTPQQPQMAGSVSPPAVLPLVWGLAEGRLAPPPDDVTWSRGISATPPDDDNRLAPPPPALPTPPPTFSTSPTSDAALPPSRPTTLPGVVIPVEMVAGQQRPAVHAAATGLSLPPLPDTDLGGVFAAARATPDAAAPAGLRDMGMPEARTRPFAPIPDAPPLTADDPDAVSPGQLGGGNIATVLANLPVKGHPGPRGPLMAQPPSPPVAGLLKGASGRPPGQQDLAITVRDFTTAAPNQGLVNPQPPPDTVLTSARHPVAGASLGLTGDLVVMRSSEKIGPDKSSALIPKASVSIEDKIDTRRTVDADPPGHSRAEGVSLALVAAPSGSPVSPDAQGIVPFIPEMVVATTSPEFGFQAVLPASAPLSFAAQNALPLVAAQLPVLAARIVQSASGTSGQVTEIALSPGELGRVRLTFRPHEADPDRIVVMMTFERPDVMDLFRRHADQLIADIRAAGFSGADLSFSQSGTQDQADSHQTGPYTIDPLTDPLLPRAAEAPLRLVSGSSLDLRL